MVFIDEKVVDEVVADTENCAKLVSVMEQAANDLFPSELGAVHFEADGYTANTWGGDYV